MTLIRRVVSAARPTVNTFFETLSTELTNTVDTILGKSSEGEDSVRRTAPERDRGQKLLAEVSEMFLRRGYALGYRPILDVYLARESARCGDRDEAIPLMRAAVDDM